MGLQLTLQQNNQILPGTYRHLLKLYQLENVSSNVLEWNCLHALPESIRQKIFCHLNDLCGRSNENNSREIYSYDSHSQLRQAIQRIAFEAFDSLDEKDKSAVGKRIWYRSGFPKVSDARWGEIHAKDDVRILLNSLDDTLLLKKIDEWVQQAPQNERTNREQAKCRIVDFFNNSLNSDPSLKNQYCLRLNGLSLINLPPIFDQEPFINRVRSLDLSNNCLEEFPIEIVKLHKLQSLDLSINSVKQLPPKIGQLRTLQSLDLSYNQLTHLPPEIGQLDALQNFNLTTNQLTNLPPEIGQLQSLKGLHISDNQLTQLPQEIGQLHRLQSLYLLGSLLTHLPREIGLLGSLQNLDVSENRSLAGLPNEVFDLPSYCQIGLEETNISTAVRNRLREVCTAPDYQGPRFSYSMETEEMPISSELPPLNELFLQLFNTAKMPPRNFPVLSALSSKKQTTLKSWLSRISDTADYQKQGVFQEKFAQKIVNYLIQAENNREFRDIFINSIQDASATCGDRVALSILKVDIAFQLTTIDRKNIRRLSTFLLGTVWPIEILEKIARDKIPSLSFYDEIEVYLGYPLQLRTKLGLEIGVENMLYFRCSALNQKDLDEAEGSVRSLQANAEKRLDYLFDRDEWMKALRTVYPDKCEKIETEIDAIIENCQTPEDYKNVERFRKEKWRELSAWALAERGGTAP